MKTPNIEESIWTKYKVVVEENKAKRKHSGMYREDELPELIYDETCENDSFEDGSPAYFPWEFTNLLSLQWVQDLLGMDCDIIFRLLNVEKGVVKVEGNLYIREQEVQSILSVLKALANTNFVNILRPIPHVDKSVDTSNPVYTSEDLMNLLNVKENTLRGYRDKGYLGYSKCKDKIWYTQKNLDDFLNHPEIIHEPFA